MKDAPLPDTRCWAYRLADDGETVESEIFASRGHIPVGLGWTDSPAKVHEAAESRGKFETACNAAATAVESAAEKAVKANEELQTAMGDDKAPLIEIAEQMSIKVDKRWGIDRLKQEIAAAMAAEPEPPAQPDLASTLPSDDKL